MGRAKNAPVDRFKTAVLNRLLQLEIDPRRRSLHQAMNQLEILAATELLASSPKQDDDIARKLKPWSDHPLQFGEQPDHSHRRRRINRLAISFIIETNVPAHNRNLERHASVAHPANDLGKLPHDFRILRAAKIQAIGKP